MALPKRDLWTERFTKGMIILSRIARNNGDIDKAIKVFNPERWISTGAPSLAKLEKENAELFNDINNFLYLAIIDEDKFKNIMMASGRFQPCKMCQKETVGGAYVRYSNDGKMIVPLCQSCAMGYDRKTMSNAEFLKQWAPKEYKCDKCGYSGHPPEVGNECPICGPIDKTKITMRTDRELN